ncbi:MAG TPA: DUF952 domain-containing protein [Pyrinomonadaceae bacterium]|jgi:uncharacterized protein (DUF952 family)|nr:DUF952 domain-containing protein [Pyrinomonadaceae bacterium]
MNTQIYHIALPEKWEAVQGDYYEHESLLTEGFIHCSFEEQLDAVLKRYFDNVESVTIVKIDPAKLTSKLIVERSTNGERFPHVYGPIDLKSVVEIEERKLR